MHGKEFMSVQRSCCGVRITRVDLQRVGFDLIL
jgi:hypothetical protein